MLFKMIAGGVPQYISNQCVDESVVRDFQIRREEVVAVAESDHHSQLSDVIKSHDPNTLHAV
jgi:hypothetical protein